MRMPFKRSVSWFLVFALFAIGLAPGVEASFSPSEMMELSKTELSKIDRARDMALIQKVLETKVIRDRLQKLGFTEDEMEARLAKMSDARIHQFANKLDELRVGGDGLEFVIAVLIIAILIVILLQMTGHRVIVK